MPANPSDPHDLMERGVVRREVEWRRRMEAVGWEEEAVALEMGRLEVRCRRIVYDERVANALRGAWLAAEGLKIAVSAHNRFPIARAAFREALVTFCARLETLLDEDG